MLKMHCLWRELVSKLLLSESKTVRARRKSNSSSRRLGVAEVMEARVLPSSDGVAFRNYADGHIYVGTVTSGTVGWTDFGAGTPQIASDYSQSGDFNGDGKTDILSVYSSGTNSGHLSVALNSGSSSFSTPTDWSTTNFTPPNSGIGGLGYGYKGYLIGDFGKAPGEGSTVHRDDIAWFYLNGSTYDFAVAISDGTQFLTPHVSGLSISGTIDTFRVLDQDGNGFSDVFFHRTPSSGPDTFNILVNKLDPNNSNLRDGYLTWDYNTKVLGDGPSSPTYQAWDVAVVGHFSGTGSTQQVAIRYLTGKRTAPPPQTWPDNDGDFWTWNGTWSSGYISRWIEDKSTGFNYTANLWQNYRVADFDLDGYSDIMGRDKSGNVVFALSSNAFGVSTTQFTVTLGVNTTSNSTDNGYGSYGGAGVFVGDLNGDSKPDILWLTTTGSTRDVVYSANSTSGGVFSFSSPSYQTNSIPSGLAQRWFDQGLFRDSNDDYGYW